jgi:hypothetical protein
VREQSRIQFVALAGVMILGLSTVAAAQNTTADPWSRVPPAPTSIYLGEDDFEQKVATASEANNADLDRQLRINAEIKKRFDAIDMMEKARLMQAYMMKNPQEAMKTMQAMQSTGEEVRDHYQASAEDTPKLAKDLANHKSNYRATLDKVLKPIQAREEELSKTKTKVIGEGDAIAWVTPADEAQYNALLALEDAEYEKIYHSYFGPNGTFTIWLAEYRNHIARDLIPAGKSMASGLVAQMAIMDTPGAGYRSTAALEGVRDYLGEYGAIYSLRQYRRAPHKKP